MNYLKTFSFKNTFIIVTVLLPVMVVSAIGAGLSGLAGINPENHGKTLVFPVGNDAAMGVKLIFGYVIVPLSLLMVILGGLNFKFKSALLNKSLLVLTAFLIGWLLFASWALDARFVDSSRDNGAPRPVQQEQTQDDLRIQTFNIN